MKFRIVLVVALLLVTAAALARPADMFAGYEQVRNGLIKASMPDVQTGARQLAAAARADRQVAVAAKAEALAAAKDLKGARLAFAALSDEMIRFRSSVKGDRPAVAYCSMEKKSWLQPKGAISNPYVDAGMRSCGEIKEQ